MQVLVYDIVRSISHRGLGAYLSNHSWITLFKQISGNHNYSITFACVSSWHCKQNDYPNSEKPDEQSI